jgi:hypothetical protein
MTSSILHNQIRINVSKFKINNSFSYTINKNRNHRLIFDNINLNINFHRLDQIHFNLLYETNQNHPRNKQKNNSANS